MIWKDFFYYYESDKRGILLLLFIILALLGLNIFWNNALTTEESVRESDSIKLAFEKFQHSLIEDERTQRARSYEERRARSYTNYKDKNFSPRQYPGGEARTREFGAARNADYKKQDKLSPGQTIAMNRADTSDWKKIPGVGSGYAQRIVKFRDLLGGYASVDQLKEVYGMNEELFQKIKPFVNPDGELTPMRVNELGLDELRKHPYLSYKQAKVITDLRKRKGKINSIKTLQLLEEFSDEDIKRLLPYLSFE